jgi:hypothetical protein
MARALTRKVRGDLFLSFSMRRCHGRQNLALRSLRCEFQPQIVPGLLFERDVCPRFPRRTSCSRRRSAKLSTWCFASPGRIASHSTTAFSECGVTPEASRFSLKPSARGFFLILLLAANARNQYPENKDSTNRPCNYPHWPTPSLLSLSSDKHFRWTKCALN